MSDDFLNILIPALFILSQVFGIVGLFILARHFGMGSVFRIIVFFPAILLLVLLTTAVRPDWDPFVGNGEIYGIMLICGLFLIHPACLVAVAMRARRQLIGSTVEEVFD